MWWQTCARADGGEGLQGGLWARALGAAAVLAPQHHGLVQGRCSLGSLLCILRQTGASCEVCTLMTICSANDAFTESGARSMQTGG